MSRRAAALLLFLLPALLSAGDKPKTFIKGARMDVLKKGEVTEFKGGVTLTRGTDFMSADRMVNWEKEGVTRAWGNVYLRRRDPERGVRWEAWGDEGVYDSNSSSGTLWGRVFMEVRESTPSVRVTRVWADRAAYDPAAGALRFAGAYPASGPRVPPPWPSGVPPRPRAVQTEGAGGRDLWGEHVTYFEADGRVVAEGGVRAFWEGGADDVPGR